MLKLCLLVLIVAEICVNNLTQLERVFYVYGLPAFVFAVFYFLCLLLNLIYEFDTSRISNDTRVVECLT